MRTFKDNAFDLIEKKYNENYNYLRNFLNKITHDENLTEDLIQETFFKLLRNPEHVLDVKYFRSWLITCARNLLIDHYRKKTPTLLRDENIIIDLLGTSTHPERQLEIKEAISEALQQCNEIDRTIFLAKEYFGYQYEEISQLLDIPVNTLKSRVFRIRKTMLSFLQRGDK